MLKAPYQTNETLCVEQCSNVAMRLTWLVFEGVASQVAIAVIGRTPLQRQRVQVGVSDLEERWRPRDCTIDRK